MKDEVILYFKDPKHTSVFRTLKEYKNPKQYDVQEYANLKEYEHGKLELEGTVIRLFYDSGKNSDCPWCGNKDIQTKATESLNAINMVEMWSECSRCGCRGPVLNVCISAFEDDPGVYESAVFQRWRSRISRD